MACLCLCIPVLANCALSLCHLTFGCHIKRPSGTLKGIYNLLTTLWSKIPHWSREFICGSHYDLSDFDGGTDTLLGSWGYVAKIRVLST